MFPFKNKKSPDVPKAKASSLFSTHFDFSQDEYPLLSAFKKTFQRPLDKVHITAPDGTAMDADALQVAKAQFSEYYQNIPDAQLGWFGSQGFIGYQICAMIAQNWLVDKACTMPARDSVRNGFEISVPEETEVDPQKITDLKNLNVRMKLSDNMVEFVRMSRIFGIRIALFNVDSTDPLYYEKPFNIDGIKKGSYKGITQVDPYWITPELDAQAAADPSSMNFYEPTWWRISGKRYHRSHLVIVRTSEVPDILKPTYFYGGIPIPQKIFDRVYAAERTANEAPMLALTKRTTALHTDLAQAEANQAKFFNQINFFAYMRDNYGIKIVGQEDILEQFDTSLADLDSAIMTQFQLVAAAAEVPSTKLMGTAPKGFNATGEYEEASYHEMLESIQRHDLTRLVDRHHLLAIKSEISPEKPFPVEVSWMPLDIPTAQEQAAINLQKAQTGGALIQSGAIDGMDERNRLIHDPDSGYASLTEIGDLSELDNGEDDDSDE